MSVNQFSEMSDKELARNLSRAVINQHGSNPYYQQGLINEAAIRLDPQLSSVKEKRSLTAIFCLTFAVIAGMGLVGLLLSLGCHK